MRNIIFVSDFFTDMYSGGAELTTDAIIEGSPYPVSKMRSVDLSISEVRQRSDSFWIFGNSTMLTDEVRMHFIKNEEYFIVEYDYKFCQFRNPDFHTLSNGTECDCENKTVGKINTLFLNSSSCIWWMSQQQREVHINKFPFLKKKKNVVLNSVFSKESVAIINQLSTIPKNDKWVILDSPSWVKNRTGSIKYAEENNLDYELVWGLEYVKLLEKLASSRGLIFLPAAKDTCPRIVIESKLLGCELITNENVQHANELWFSDKDSILEHLETRNEVFWKEVERYV